MKINNYKRIFHNIEKPDFHGRDGKRQQASGILSTFTGELSERGNN